MLILLFFIFSNSQTIYRKLKKIPALQVRFKRKLLKKLKKKKHTSSSNKLENCLPAKVSILYFYIFFRNYKKKIHLKRIPFSNYEELPCKHGVLKLTNIMGNKSIPRFCKLNPISACQVAGKFRFLSF